MRTVREPESERRTARKPVRFLENLGRERGAGSGWGDYFPAPRFQPTRSWGGAGGDAVAEPGELGGGQAAGLGWTEVRVEQELH
jgi:hypothetical protein